MNNRTLAVVSYITIIGWLIAYFSYKDQAQKSALVNYHLEQSFGLFIVSILLSVAVYIVVSIIPGLAIAGTIIGLVTLILMVLGIINAYNQALRPLPLVGKFFEKKIRFLT